MKKWIVPVLSSIIISSCNPDSSQKNTEGTPTKEDITNILTNDTTKLDGGKEEVANFLSANIAKDTLPNIDISESLIDAAIKGEMEYDMKDILHTIRQNNDRENAKYIALNYQNYRYGGDAVGVMYSIANKISSRDKLSYVAQTYSKYGYASDCFVAMYDLYKKNPTPEKKKVLVKLAQKEYDIRAPMPKEIQWGPKGAQSHLLPERETFLAIAKELLGK